MLYFPQIKNTTPQIGDFGATETALAPAPVFMHSLLETSVLGSRPANTRNWMGSSNCVELFKQWATCSYFFSFLPLLSYLFLFFPLGNGLKPV